MIRSIVAQTMLYSLTSVCLAVKTTTLLNGCADCEDGAEQTFLGQTSQVDADSPYYGGADTTDTEYEEYDPDKVACEEGVNSSDCDPEWEVLIQPLLITDYEEKQELFEWVIEQKKLEISQLFQIL